jgi:phosphate:Na+ symporter
VRLDLLAAADDEVDDRHRELVDFLGRLGQGKLTERQTDELVGLLAAANDLESIGDVIETNLVRLGRRRLASNIDLDPETHAEILRVHQEVLKALELATRSLLEGDTDASNRSVEMKSLINELLGGTASSQRLDIVYHHEGPRAVEVYSLVREIGDNLQRIYYFARRIARIRLQPDDDGDDVDDVGRNDAGTDESTAQQP